MGRREKRVEGMESWGGGEISGLGELNQRADLRLIVLLKKFLMDERRSG